MVYPHGVWVIPKIQHLFRKVLFSSFSNWRPRISSRWSSTPFAFDSTQTHSWTCASRRTPALFSPVCALWKLFGMFCREVRHFRKKLLTGKSGSLTFHHQFFLFSLNDAQIVGRFDPACFLTATRERMLSDCNIADNIACPQLLCSVKKNSFWRNIILILLL